MGDQIKSLRDEALPLFAAADDRDSILRPEIVEPAVTLTPMTLGREVVEDYRSKGLSLRAHPLRFLRQSLSERGYVPCTALRDTPDGGHISIGPRPRPANAGLRQGRHVHHAGR